MNDVPPRRLAQVACFAQSLLSAQNMQAALTPGPFLWPEFAYSPGCMRAHKSLWFVQHEAAVGDQGLNTSHRRGVIFMCKGEGRQTPMN